MSFQERIKKARLEKGLTQDQLSGLIGVAKSTYNGYEKGNREPDFFKLKKLIEVLEVDANYLLCVDEDNLPAPPNQTKKAPTEETSESDFEKQRLLHNYDRLNPKGRQALIEYSDDLASMPKYTDEPSEVKKQA